MTDEQMDARLRRAGEAWRASATLVVEVAPEQVHELAQSPGRRPLRHRTGLLASAALVAAALVAGGSVLVATLTSHGSGPASGSENAATGQLTDRPWTLVAIKDAAGNDVAVAGAANLTISSAGGIKGQDGCNYLGAVVKLTDRTLDIAGLGTTAMACAPRQIMTTAQYVDRVLEGQVDWRIDGDRLTLTKDGVGTLVYRGDESTAPGPVPLFKTIWRLTTIEHGTGPDGSASSVVTDVVLSVPGDGSVTITHRCYVDAGDARVTGNILAISDKQLKRAVPCPATQTQTEEQQQNQVVDDVLTGRSTWSITHGQLRIAKDGVGALVFEPPTGRRSSAKHPGR